MTKTEIETLRSEGKTYQEIADYFHVSRQRIHQIYKDYTAMPDGVKKAIRKRDIVCQGCGSRRNLHVHHKDGVRNNNHQENLVLLCVKCHMKAEKELHIFLGKKREANGANSYVKPEQRKCLRCETIFEVLPSVKKKYCSKKCSDDAHRKYKDEKEKNRIRARRFYEKHKNEPHYQEKLKEYRKNFYYSEAGKKWRKKYWEIKGPEMMESRRVAQLRRYREDEAYREKVKAKYREYYRQKVANDPVWVAKNRERHKKAYKIRVLAAKKLSPV